MTDTRELSRRLDETAKHDDRFAICARIHRCYLGRSPDDRAALLVPCTLSAHAIARATGALLISFKQKVSFSVDANDWTTAAVVVENLDPLVLPTFVALAVDVATQLGDTGELTSAAVIKALSGWERLLRGRAVLGDEEQLGLWGELQFIARSPSIDGAIRAWAPGADEAIDFTGNGVGVEIKASTSRLKHRVSHQQARSGDAALKLLFCSVWAVPDALGASLPMLVEEIGRSAAELVLFEQKLLAVGYRREDAHAYLRRYARADELFFHSSDIPRVRAFDAGISQIRYVVDLDAANALGQEDAAKIVATVCGVTSL